MSQGAGSTLSTDTGREHAQARGRVHEGVGKRGGEDNTIHTHSPLTLTK
jgi:hypothetical protein